MARLAKGQRPPNRPAAARAAFTVVPPLTTAQRRKVLAHYTTNPDSGYKAALAAAGIHATQAAAKIAIVSDDELHEHALRCLKVDEASLLKRLGEMSADTDHKDSLRATTFALAALHGYRDRSEVSHVGPAGGPMQLEVEDRSASLAEVAEALRAALPVGREAAG